MIEFVREFSKSSKDFIVGVIGIGEMEMPAIFEKKYHLSWLY
jgi:hypothetical protein